MPISENSETGGKSKKDTLSFPGDTIQKQSIEAYIQRIEELSRQIGDVSQEIADEKIEAKKIKFDIKGIEEELSGAKKINLKLETLVFFGFIALLVVVAGIGYAYIEFTYNGVILDSYKHDVGIKTETNSFVLQEMNTDLQNMNTENELLKKNNDEMANILNCQKGKRYWQYEQCFK
jgi:uncharacterized protein (UPF0335 family)